MEIRLSFSAWSKLKDCPHSYMLRYIRKIKGPQDNFYTIVGKVPGRQAEDYYKTPVADRKLSFFADTFEKYWQEQIEGSTDLNHHNHIEWVKHGTGMLYKSGVANVTQEQAFRAAYLDRYHDAKGCSLALAKLIESARLTDVEAETEVEFLVKIEPGMDDGAVPTLILHGFIDLIVMREGNDVEVWDWKATKHPSKLDLDQLVFYGLAVKNGGANVTKTGYLLIRQNKVDRRNVTTAMEYATCKALRQIGVYYDKSFWPANFREWKCRSCDVRHACETARQKLGPNL
jgi:CRISPR/Cas system-associated exonuclease Cas4 (RecB family)